MNALIELRSIARRANGREISPNPGRLFRYRYFAIVQEQLTRSRLARVCVRHQVKDNGGTMANLPIVCTLTPKTLATRKAQLLPGLFRRAAAAEATQEGFRLRFDSAAETLHAIAAAIEAERHCCRFLRFELAVEPDEGPLVLTLSGPPGAREFVAALCDG
jgi:hypothetical protein